MNSSTTRKQGQNNRKKIAYQDAGDVTWEYSGSWIVISGVHLNGLEFFFPDFHTVITVPRHYGHYTGTVGTFLTLPDVIDPNGGTS